jgi:hypothetical protein
VVQTLEETLKTIGGGNAGGNIPDDVLAQLAAWAKLYGRADHLCRWLSEAGKGDENSNGIRHL